MKFIDRLILLLTGLVFLAFAGLFAVVAMGIIPMDRITFILENIPKGWLTVVIMAAFVCLFLFIAIKLLFMRPKRDKIQSCLIKNDTDGEIYISVSAIDNIVKMAILSFSDVKNLKIRIKATKTGVIVFGKIFAPIGINFPELLTNIKYQIKRFVEEKAGIAVDQIRLVCVEAAPITNSNRPQEIPVMAMDAIPTDKAAQAAPEENSNITCEANSVVIAVDASSSENSTEDTPSQEQDDADILLG